ncbi:hypothetical protein NLG97_g4159 [Lecanicillium saksenae]|uniref:Uncharacterized protein n=1 Tax=Lecanicillium saksenae TaxID=468837 RepID=A0ACC1QW39_9HYPO|nr:hypothetical protein NLG97_g4159 [Lecanicillium saksenae]
MVALRDLLTGATIALPILGMATKRNEDACTSYTIISARGTFEPQGPSLGFNAMNGKILQQKKGGNVYNVVYPAAIGQDSSSGTADIIKKVNELVSQDNTVCIILQGYSQGASATCDALPQLQGAAFEAVKAVVLLGNPEHQPDLKCNVDGNGGKSTLNAKGFYSLGKEGIPPTWVSKSLDICNFPHANRDKAAFGGLFLVSLSAQRSWTKAVVQLEETDEALRSIVLALGSGFVAASSKPGTPSGDLRLLNVQTIWLYYRAIWSLKQAAKTPRRLQGDGMLAATKLVQVFEMFFGESVRNLRADGVSRYDSIAAHYRGQIAIIANRGPDDFASGFAHDLFIDFRLYLTVSAIFVRTTLSINEGEWRKAPWSIIPKGPKDVLTDIIHEVVTLLKSLDQLRAFGGAVKTQTELLSKATRVQNALQLWFSDLPREAEQFDYTRSESMPIEVTSDRQLSLLYLVNLYWCTCMLIETTIGFLEQIHYESLAPPSPTVWEQHTESEEPDRGGRSKKEMAEIGVLSASRCHAYKVARSAHLMRGSAAGICYYMMSVVPISIALSLLIASEPVDQISLERQQLQRALEGHALRSWVLQFADATENSAARLEHAKSRRLRWWTRLYE